MPKNAFAHAEFKRPFDSDDGVVVRMSLGLAVMIPLVHGVAGLIPPNSFMPDYVRHAHMLEIGWSNFALGLLIGFLFWNPPQGGDVESPVD